MTPDQLFSDEAQWQAWLDVEAALARCQAKQGTIPAEAAQVITDAARLEVIGADNLRQSIAQTMAPIVSLTRCLAEASGEYGRFVHWGATTQNVTQTGRLLQMRQAQQHMLGDLGRAFASLSDWASRYCGAPMAARTNRSHALPITFGFKVAGWIDELDRAVQRIEQAGARTFSLPFGGAVGAFHSFGDQGPGLMKLLSQELDLAELMVPNRTVNDLFVEHVVQLAMLGMSIERISMELYSLMEDGISEMRERLDDSVIGSSTMPHKNNPKHVVRVIANCARLRAQVAPAMEAGRPSHEGDSAANQLLSMVVEEACPLAWRVSTGFADLLEIVEPDIARMERNLTESAVLMASENLMMALAPTLGRGRAHDVVHHGIQEAGRTGQDMTEAMLAIPEIAALGRDRVLELLDSRTYTGSSVALATQSAARAAEICRALSGAGTGAVSGAGTGEGGGRAE